MTQRIRVWDLPTRLFHWMLALSFLVAYLTGESERWALLHVTAGYTLLGLIGFRLVWGLAGTRYARFSEFVTGFATVRQYLSGLIQGRPRHYVGHNPAGALAILALLLLGIASGVSGWLVYEDIGGEWLEEVHESVSALMLAIVVVHIAGVLVSSRIHGENLVRSMLNGKKEGEASQAIASNRPLVALLLLAGLIGFWGWSFSGAEAVGLAGDDQSAAPLAKPDADENDD
jgi:cytochrome b